MTPELVELHRRLVELLSGDSPEVLEAGCGSISRLSLPAGTHLVGIDISENQLRRNTQLHERILGDVTTHPLPASRFDLVVCWDVLEHLTDPARALDNLFGSVRPGGLVLVALPNLWSLKGLITRLTPFSVHRAFYRYVIGDRRPATEFDQFPTYLRLAVAPRRITRFAASRGFDVRFFRLYQGPVQTWMRRHKRWADIGFGLLDAISTIVSFGTFNLNHSDCLILLQKRSDAGLPRDRVGMPDQPAPSHSARS
ncbi:MAG: methyltransferase domain-containing protein [Burkholderiaceae bacterium]|nr:methyltransferase domain-containing protein [Burkholderiaceae bacterium]MEB2350094.1 class I SAM-dependent methyltransferase [Burkholderiaceae bacterium]